MMPGRQLLLCYGFPTVNTNPLTALKGLAVNGKDPGLLNRDAGVETI